MENDTSHLETVGIKNNFLNSKNIWFGILFLAITLAAACLYGFTLSSKQNIPLTEKKVGELSLSTKKDASPLNFFYYTIKPVGDKEINYKLYRATTDLDNSNINTHDFTFPSSGIITNSWKDNTILFVSGSKSLANIYSLDVSVKNSKPELLFTIPLDSNKNEQIGDVRFINNGESLAFITANGVGENIENSMLNIVSLTNKQTKESYLLNKASPLYASFKFLSITTDNTTLYLNEAGGDAGAIWSQWYIVNRTSKNVQKLEKLPPLSKEGERNPAISAFNSDSSKLAYIDFSSEVEQNDLSGGCLNDKNDAINKYEAEGGTVMLYDFQNGTSSELFRSLTYSNNYCKNVARQIKDIKWLDNTRIAFETVDGIYSIDTSTKKVGTIFLFPKTYNPGQVRPLIFSIQLPYIIFSDYSVAQINSNKILQFTESMEFRRNFFVLKK